MISVRIWNLESDSEARAVKFLENEFLRFRQLEHLAIRKVRRSALRKCHKKGSPINSCLLKVIQHYLKQDDYIIFVVDPNPQRQQASKLLVNQLRWIVKNENFSDKVFFLPDLQESEFTIPIQWQRIVSRFRAEVESERKRFREEWDKTVTHFHNAFANIPEEEVIRDFEEALAEVRRERA